MKTPAGVAVALRPTTPAGFHALAARSTRFVVWRLHSGEVRALIVEERSPGWWAVSRDGRCLNLANGWEIEPKPARRTELWLRWHRFADVDSAVRAAAQALAGDHGWLAEHGEQ